MHLQVFSMHFILAELPVLSFILRLCNYILPVFAVLLLVLCSMKRFIRSHFRCKPSLCACVKYMSFASIVSGISLFVDFLQWKVLQPHFVVFRTNMLATLAILTRIYSAAHFYRFVQCISLLALNPQVCLNCDPSDVILCASDFHIR